MSAKLELIGMVLLVLHAQTVKFGMEIIVHAHKICTGMVIAVFLALMVRSGR